MSAMQYSRSQVYKKPGGNFLAKLIAIIVAVILIIGAIVTVAVIYDNKQIMLKNIHIGDSEVLLFNRLGAPDDTIGDTYYWLGGADSLDDAEILANKGVKFVYIAVKVDANRKISKIECLYINSRHERKLSSVQFLNAKEQYAVGEDVDVSAVAYHALFTDYSYVEDFVTNAEPIDSSAAGTATVKFSDEHSPEYRVNINIVGANGLSEDYRIVSFELNGGEGATPYTIKAGDTIDFLPQPTKSAYAFDGWYVDDSLTTAFNTESIITTNLKLFAKWKQTASLSFDSKGGSAIATQYGVPTDLTTEPDDPTREGYRFEGWFVDEACTTPYVFASFANAASADKTTIYAKWTKGVSITINKDNGMAPTVISGYAGDPIESVDKPSNPTKTDFKFLGWFSPDVSGTQFTFGNYPAEDTTVVAKWEQQYTVTFYNGTTVFKTDTKFKGDTITLPSSLPTKSGYLFDGWYTGCTVENGVVLYGSATKFVVGTKMPANDVSIYAKWSDRVEIRTAEELIAIAANTTSLARSYVLMDDIDLANAEWVPIGSSNTNAFTGVFDGNGHTISNFKVTATTKQDNAGLFGINKGLIQNLKVLNPVFEFSTNTNETAIGGLCATNKGTIENCFVISTRQFVAQKINAEVRMGGLVATNDGTIKTSYASIMFTASTDLASAKLFVGGLVGVNNGSTVNSFASSAGDINCSVVAQLYGGGVVSYGDGDVTNCYFDKTPNFTGSQSTGGTNRHNNTSGTRTSNDNLRSAAWVKSTLKWSGDIWDLNSTADEFPQFLED